MKAKILKQLRTDRGSNIGPKPGSILEGRLLPTGLLTSNFQCTEAGPYMGLIFGTEYFQVLPDDAQKNKVVKLEEELIIRSKAIQRMQNEIDRQQAAYDAALADIAKHGQKIRDLQNECRRLESEVDEARDAKKVVLPREAVAELDKLMKCGCTVAGIVFDSIASPVFKREVEMWGIDPSTLAKALVNGYTVEEPSSVEDNLKDKLHNHMQAQGVQSPIPLDRLAEQLTLVAREVLAGQRSDQEMMN